MPNVGVHTVETDVVVTERPAFINGGAGGGQGVQQIGLTGISGYSGAVGISGYSGYSGFGDPKKALGIPSPFKLPEWLCFIKETCNRQYSREMLLARSVEDYGLIGRIVERYKKVDDALIEMELFYYEYGTTPSNSNLYELLLKNILLQDPNADGQIGSFITKEWIWLMRRLKEKDGSISVGLINAVLTYLNQKPLPKSEKIETYDNQALTTKKEKISEKIKKNLKKVLLFRNFFVYLQKFFKR